MKLLEPTIPFALIAAICFHALSCLAEVKFRSK